MWLIAGDFPNTITTESTKRFWSNAIYSREGSHQLFSG